MRPSRQAKDYDVAVVGAGPIGAAAALAFAQRGASVIVFEANPNASRRLAGEWLHPPGVEVLGRLGIDVAKDAPGSAPGQGFVVFPDDKSSARSCFPIPTGCRGFRSSTRTWSSLVRSRAAAHEKIDLRLGARVRGIVDGIVTVENANGLGEDLDTFAVDRVVGADGRSSVARKRARHQRRSDRDGLHRGRRVARRRASVRRVRARLGRRSGSGPRCTASTRSACAPASTFRSSSSAAWSAAIRRRSGTPTRTFCRRRSSTRSGKSLDEKRVQWAAAGFRPRAHYGRGRVALAGDAVGYFHPMTAAGMSLGLADAECVADSPDVASYRRLRDAKSWVPELLACALYLALTRRDPSGVAVRQAVYRLWRRSEDERRRTMRILACADTRPEQFVGRVPGRALGPRARGPPARLAYHARDADASWGLDALARRLDRSPSRPARLPRAKLARLPPLGRASLNGGEPVLRPADPIGAALAHLVSKQDASGSWKGDYGGPLFLLPIFVATAATVGYAIDAGTRAGDAGLPARSPEPRRRLGPARRGSEATSSRPSFPTSRSDSSTPRRRIPGLVARASVPRRARWSARLGVVGEVRARRARASTTGTVCIRFHPSCGSFPESLPIHPSRLWCHSRMVYLPMAYLYGRRATVAARRAGRSRSAPSSTSMRVWDDIDWRGARNTVSSTDRYVPRSSLARVAFRALDRRRTASPGGAARHGARPSACSRSSAPRTRPPTTSASARSTSCSTRSSGTSSTPVARSCSATLRGFRTISGAPTTA